MKKTNISIDEVSKKHFWTTDETAMYLGLSVSYIYKLVGEKSIAYYKSKGGKRIYFKPEDVTEWALSRRSPRADEMKHQAELYVAKTGGVL